MIEGEVDSIKNAVYRIYLFIHVTILFGEVDYTTQVQPIFYNHCLDCHVAVNGSGALELDSYEYLMQGDSNNGPVVIPFNPDSSLLYRVLLPMPVIVPNEPICCQMPKNAEPLSLEQQTIIYNWINEGAIGPTVSIQEYALKQPTVLRVYPNPFNNRVEISYKVIESGPVNVSIFDIVGKQVKAIARVEHNIGWHSVFWDGTDNAGRTVSGGIYLIRLQSLERLEIIEKILYIK